MTPRLASLLQRLSQAVFLLCLLASLAVFFYPHWSAWTAGSAFGAYLDRNWDTLLTALLTTVLGGACLGFGPMLLAWLARKSDAVTIARCAVPNRQQRASVVQIYSDNFADDENYDAEELQEILRAASTFGHRRPLPTEMILYLATRSSSVCAFLLAFYYPTKQRAIIGYLAGTRDQKPSGRAGSDDTTLRLIRACFDDLRSRGCDLVFYELADTSASIKPSQRQRQKARLALFKDLAREAGAAIYALDFPYVCPRVSVQPTALESRALLHCIPLSGSLPPTLTKDTVADYLQFIYVDCYGDFYPMGSTAFGQHRDYLQSLLSARIDQLPGSVRVLR